MPNPGAHADTSVIYGQEFFPHLISEPFRHGLLIAFSASIIMLLLAAGASLMRGAKLRARRRHEHRVVDGAAREGGALSVPALPDEDVAYDDALAGRSSA